ncbi:E3 ubiquitin-protein ligase TRIM9 [Orussus abietinus]|uniref:E3 ubiquitin-protein ligase TRIM9 n=1 Tax=Orussus abietinus TaxID=222816 RepID=UPI000625C078|nr:E3 ubiquitin-protein ligase TRIM9 [Orussus abietinus]
MEDELRCPACKSLLSEPVLLPCWHALCLACAVNLQAPPDPLPDSAPSSDQEADKLSILSETDSGVVCGSGSRPGSYVGTPANGTSPPSGGTLYLCCPVCRKNVFFDEGGAYNLPKYRAMRRIVDKYRETRSAHPLCQMCETEPGEATVACDQCEIRYCDACRESCHPNRGPLASHNLGPPGPGSQRGAGPEPSCACACPDHGGETLGLYCAPCKLAACSLCVRDRHAAHPRDVLPLAAACKTQKTELSQNLQHLSEKARSTTEFIQRLKGLTDRVHEEFVVVEEEIEQRVAALVALLQSRKDRLLDVARQTREARVRCLRDQVSRCAAHLQGTTSLLTFCIEALKETDGTAFLQIGGMLSARVANAVESWVDAVGIEELTRLPLLDFTLDDQSLRRAIDQLAFTRIKPSQREDECPVPAPAAPLLIPEECSAENNSVTVAWQPPPSNASGCDQRCPDVDGYLLELDDGRGGDFREVYCGRETMCTIDGLHFDSLYKARVRAFNCAGEGEYSELIGLQTAEVAWFSWSTATAGVPQEVSVSDDAMSVSCAGYEHRVILSNIGFSRGVHYWEMTVDRYHSDTDPAFGVARAEVTRDQMLGKDDKGWSMYIDRQRSWFMHGGGHAQRTEGGVQQGSTVGVLLDLETAHTLQFFVNDQPQGGVAFRDLYGIFYPAVSLNRGVSVTLHTALEVPRRLVARENYPGELLQS